MEEEKFQIAKQDFIGTLPAHENCDVRLSFDELKHLVLSHDTETPKGLIGMQNGLAQGLSRAAILEDKLAILDSCSLDKRIYESIFAISLVLGNNGKGFERPAR